MESVNKERKILSAILIYYMNFALIITLIYTLGLMPYAYLKGLFPKYVYVIFLLFVIAYSFFWYKEVINGQIKNMPNNI